LKNPFQQIVEEAMETSIQKFVVAAETAATLLRKEDGNVGKLHILGRHVEIQPSGEAIIVSDLHGDLESLVHILEESNIQQRMEDSEDACLIFLGDYGDRGPFSAEVYYTILQLKLEYPKQIVLMRGNHEGPKDLLAIPHDLPIQFRAKFGAKWKQAYNKITALFSHLYNSVTVQERYLIVHGGLPEKARSIDDFAYAHEKHTENSFLEEILWSDPLESQKGAHLSPRGAGRLFGRDVTERVLKSIKTNVVIRGHEPCSDGFQINHDGKILTLFSRKGAPYYNAYGAYLDLDLSGIHASAGQLVPFIHRF
jgi:protein phosphatase